MRNSAHFSSIAPIFHGKQSPEEGCIVGYSAIIDRLKLPVPIPGTISLVCKQNKSYQKDGWKVFPKTYLPEDNSNSTEIEALYRHLVFALKYEGVNLLVFSFLTQHYENDQLAELVNIEPTGQYSRRIWFLIEWISGKELDYNTDLRKKSYVDAVDTKIQYAVSGEKSPRHLVINNLPGTPDFCPLIHKTDKLESFLNKDYSDQKSKYLNSLHKEILQRASAFLLLKDSKASFTIEGESPKSKRAARWGKAIGQAGTRELTKEELLRLQQIVIENSRFVDMGFRKKGGFIGNHDRVSGEPIPDHISARWQDIDELLDGLIDTNKLLLSSNMDAVLVSAVIAFGFVFIHPFIDGNGRIHRYLIHDILAKKKFSKQGMIFPVSSSILDHLDDYKKVLESYSQPLLDFIEWKETKDHNVEVLGKSINYYRYFDATIQAEFLYECVADTLTNIIPSEVNYITNYDEFKKYIDDDFEMPDKMVALLVRFLEQNDGKLTKRARNNEFESLSEDEINKIESKFDLIFRIK